MFRNCGNPTLHLGEFRSSSKSRTQAKILCKVSNYVMKNCVILLILNYMTDAVTYYWEPYWETLQFRILFHLNCHSYVKMEQCSCESEHNTMPKIQHIIYSYLSVYMKKEIFVWNRKWFWNQSTEAYIMAKLRGVFFLLFSILCWTSQPHNT